MVSIFRSGSLARAPNRSYIADQVKRVSTESAPPLAHRSLLVLQLIFIHSNTQ